MNALLFDKVKTFFQFQEINCIINEEDKSITLFLQPSNQDIQILLDFSQAKSLMIKILLNIPKLFDVPKKLLKDLFPDLKYIKRQYFYSNIPYFDNAVDLIQKIYKIIPKEITVKIENKINTFIEDPKKYYNSLGQNVAYIRSNNIPMRNFVIEKEDFCRIAGIQNNSLERNFFFLVTENGKNFIFDYCERNEDEILSIENFEKENSLKEAFIEFYNMRFIENLSSNQISEMRDVGT